MRSRRRAGRLAVLVLLVTSTALAAGCGSGAGDGSDRSVSSLPTTRSPSPTGLSMPAEGPISPGTYRMPASGWSVAGYSITFGPGWVVQYGHVFVRNQDSPTEIGFYTVVVDRIYEDACGASEATRAVGAGVDGLLTALAEQPGPDVSAPAATTLGGRPATRVDLRVPAGLELGSCRLALDGVDGLQVWFSPPADKYFVLLPQGSASAYVLEPAGRRQVVLTQQHDATPPEDVAALRAVLDSIRFEE